jgi:uncharacterized membrane protein
MAMEPAPLSHPPPVLFPGMLIGAAFAGLCDGTVFHQILGWHHLFSGERTPEQSLGLCRENELWDGVFHAGCLGLAAIAITSLWRARQALVAMPTSAFVGTVLLGGGMFNVLEGIVDHHLLRIHHVRAGELTLAYDAAFLVLSGGIAACGYALLARASKQRTPPT